MKLRLHHLGYVINVKPIEIQGILKLSKAFIFRLSKLTSRFEIGLSRPVLVRTRDGYLFYCRPRTPDLYTVCCHELYELKKWFRPLVGRVFVDIGAYIGTYTVRACRNFEVVVSIEPLPQNFAVLKKNVELNQCHSKVVLINKAIGPIRRRTYMKIPRSVSYISYSTASLKPVQSSELITVPVVEEPLDDILNSLSINKIDLMKVDVEGYTIQALPGMVNSLRRTRYLFIEISGEELGKVHRELKISGFKLVDAHGSNYLYLNENMV